ncbi:MAG: hypothetical protein CEE43_03015 [Promethearchaeota archaeon Loki_b32]|nr:MAG: hypothetical protein CEE43_03015 [Candidatus Lokiarchaeota archaeon Loki_b32]
MILVILHIAKYDQKYFINFVALKPYSDIFYTLFLLLITPLRLHETMFLLREHFFLKIEMIFLNYGEIACILENCRCIFVLF